jgi:hypothetical protein
MQRSTKIRRRARELARNTTKKLIKELGLSLKFVRVNDDCIRLQLLRKARNIGSIALYLDDDGGWQTASVPGLPQSLRGIGLGLYMYEELIDYGLNHGFRVQSSPILNRNDLSDAIWEKLIHRFQLRERRGRYFVLRRR